MSRDKGSNCEGHKDLWGIMYICAKLISNMINVVAYHLKVSRDHNLMK